MKKKVQALNSAKNNLFQKLITWFVGSFIALVVLLFACYHLAYWHKIYPGIKILGYSVGNQTVAQATKTIEASLAQIQPQLELKTGKQRWDLDLTKIEFTYQANATARKAYQVGREGKTFNDFQSKIRSWLKGTNINPEYTFNQNLFDSQIATISTQIYIPAIEPTIKVSEATPSGQTSRITIEQGKDGQEVDKRKLFSLINYQFATANFQAVDLPLIKISPTLTPQQIENTRQRAEKFLDKKLILTTEQANWELKEEDLIEFLSFTNGFDQDKIASWSASLAISINRSPQNATFQFSGGKVVEFRPAQEGENLDQKKTINLMAQNMAKLEQGEKEMTIKLPIITTSPAIRTADVNTLGIKEIIGKGISYFRGSISSRVHNIQLASSKLNGILIPPGETFSFNQSLGEVSQLTGYKEAYIIKEGRTILGDGGGVCQVSTTLFRAVLNAGLPILERHAHAYRVSYYEQSSDVGLDATVFDPTADLKIKNDTPTHILIQTQVDTKKNTLTFELYGTSDGRKITLSKSRIWDQTPPPPDLYQDDPTLPPGTTKQIDWKAWGAKVAFDYHVERNGEILQNRTFYSNYRSWQAIYLRGPATQ